MNTPRAQAYLPRPTVGASPGFGRLPLRAAHETATPISSCARCRQSHRKDANQRETGRLDELPARRNANHGAFRSSIRRARESRCRRADGGRRLRAFWQFCDHVFAELHHVCAISEFEFMRKGSSKPPVDPPREIHSVTMRCFDRMVRTNSSRRSHSASSARLPSGVSR